MDWSGIESESPWQVVCCVLLSVVFCVLYCSVTSYRSVLLFFFCVLYCSCSCIIYVIVLYFVLYCTLSLYCTCSSIVLSLLVLHVTLQ
jgi:hypothetical protein